MAKTMQLPLAGSGSIQFEVDDASSGRPCRGVGDGKEAARRGDFEGTAVSRGLGRDDWCVSVRSAALQSGPPVTRGTLAADDGFAR